MIHIVCFLWIRMFPMDYATGGQRSRSRLGARRCFHTQALARWRCIVAGAATGKIYAWGFNAYGQLGDGTSIYRPNPVVVVGIANAAAVACGSHFTLVLLSAPHI